MSVPSENQEKQEVCISDMITSNAQRNEDNFLKNEQKCNCDDYKTNTSHESIAKIGKNEIKNYIKSIKVPKSSEEKVHLLQKILEVLIDYGKNVREIIDRSSRSSRLNCELQKPSEIQHDSGSILRKIEEKNSDQVSEKEEKKINQVSSLGSCSLPPDVKWTSPCPNVKLAAKCLVTLTINSKKTKNIETLEETENFAGLFEGSIKDFPISGFQWLKILHQHTANGILADEISLPKTIQVIAMITYLISNNSEGPFLIIAPLTTLLHWLSEFKELSPKVPVILLKGKNFQKFQEAQSFKIEELPNNKMVYPVALTSHETFVKQRTFFLMFKWSYVVVDQGNHLKKFNSKLINTFLEIQSGSKLMLTEPILKNNLKVLCSLLRFLFSEIVDIEDKKVMGLFDDLYSNIIVEQELKEDIISKLLLALNSFTLRMKNDVLKLPPKKEVVINCPMTQVQWELYNATLDGSIYRYLGIENTSMPPKRCIHDVSSSESDTSGEIIFERLAKRMRTQNGSHDFGENASHADESERNKRMRTRLKNLDAKSSNQLKGFSKDSTGNPCSINLNMRQPMYVCLKLSNHPYLIQWPVDNKGEPLVDGDLIYKSGKIMVLDELLPYLHARGHRVLLFTCMVSTLDLLEVYVQFRGYKYAKMQAHVTLTKKVNEINKFLNTDDVFLFLMSTKLSPTSLNLTRSDTIIFFDTVWNEQFDLLAQELCHRIGQTKPVVVYRFLTKSSIDVMLAERVQSNNASEAITSQHQWNEGCQHSNEEISITVKELRALMSSKDYSEVVTSSRSLFSTQEIQDLLDRSDMI